MTDDQRPNRAASDAGAHADHLTRILVGQLEAHRALRRLVEEKREAIRTADVDAIVRACEEEEKVVRSVRDVERQRVALVKRLSRMVDPAASEPLALSAIAAALDEPRRERLESVSEALREEVVTVRRQSAIVAAAAEALSRHVSGLMQTVYRALSGAGTYERRGRLAVGAAVEGGIDMTS